MRGLLALKRWLSGGGRGFAVVALAALVGCSNGDGGGTGDNNDNGSTNGSSGTSGSSSTDAVCVAGTQDCTCTAASGCLSVDLACTAGTCQPCAQGATGCGCLPGAECLDGNDSCAAGRCAPTPCPTGGEGCACTSDNRCGINDRGQQLSCMGGSCVVSTCPPGQTGCACAGGNACNDASNSCRDGFCRPGNCIAGELNCECTGGACNGANLICRDGSICVDNTGFPGGPCNSSNRCEPGGRCQGGTCLPCVPGSLSCNCGAGDTCFEGLMCTAGLCVTDDRPFPPANPVCYTPCQAGLTSASTDYRACAADGLMDGCVGNTSCTEGSCIPPSGSVPTCESDVQCPDWQTCIRGKCYSNCTTDGDCSNGNACFRHVCRKPCSAGATSACGEGQYCNTATGTDGYCGPQLEPTGEPQTENQGTFTVEPAVVSFSNIQTGANLRITNNSLAFERFRIRKLDHNLQRADTSFESLEDVDDETECVAGQTCPLFWLEMGPQGATARAQSLTITLEPGETRVLSLAKAGDIAAVRWQGSLEIIHDKMGKRAVRLAYAERPEGQWAGNVYFFATFGDRDLGRWADPSHPEYLDMVDKQQLVGNAFIQRWGAFRRGQISWDEFQAVLTATKTESWRYPSVQRACGGGSQRACYLYDGAGVSGVSTYTTDNDSVPIPTGITELPIAFNLRMPNAEDTPQILSGRIESSKALQYAGNPAVTMTFANAVTNCTKMAQGACLTILQNFNADILVGGRYVPSPNVNGCSERTDGSYSLKSFPWLLPGFQRSTSVEGEGAQRMRSECRDERLPFTSPVAAEREGLKPLNVALAGANPVPDGRSRTRQLRLLDGAIVNQSQMFIIFEERFPSFMDPADPVGFKAYGYMVLERARVDMPQDDKNANQVPDIFDGSDHTDSRVNPTDILAPQCSDALLSQILPAGSQLTATTAGSAITALLDGVVGTSNPTLLTYPYATEEVHYLCRDNGLIDGGAGNTTRRGDPVTNGNTCATAFNNRCDDGGPGSSASSCGFGTDRNDCGLREAADRDVRIPCPAGSQVTFFTTDPSRLNQAQIAALPCQRTGTCAAEFPNLTLVQRNVLWRCEAGLGAYCDDNRLDLRRGKEFYSATETRARFVPLATQVDEAFLYKTRFRSRTGATVGFAPTICGENVELAPYCYSPDKIEAARERVDCLLSIWNAYRGNASIQPSTNTAMLQYLQKDFAYTQRNLPQGGLPEVKDGFEKLYAELLIMLGDEAYTASFASRFDLAATRQVSFPGSAFEGPTGIDLSGVAGFEMFSLYQAVQYYQEALDRFYEMSPLVWRSVGLGSSESNFVTPATITSYFQRLVRASTQKTRAMSQIARKYQAFNRADLARAVVERAYTAAYLESVVMARLMIRVLEGADAAKRAELRKAVEDSQRSYRVAMLEMRDVYDAITDRATLFGLTADYVPLPALDQGQPNAFEVVAVRAQEKSRVAREREDLALSANRSYETDAQQFQAELSRIRNTYENQLGDLCGTFVAGGRVYPATRKYAELDPRAKALQEPCGLMGNGAIHEALAQVDQARLDILAVNQQTDNVIREAEIENQRVSEQCQITTDLADYVFEQQGDIATFRDAINGSRNAMSALDRSLSVASTLAGLGKCSIVIGTSTGGDCPAAGISIGVFTAAAVAVNVAAVGLEVGITVMESQINSIERDTARYQTLSMCSAAKVDSNARQATLLLRLKELDLDRLRNHRRLALAVSEITEKYNQATRIQLEQQDTEQLTINVEAARNDPNVRIYKNDAVINADLSFYDAAQEAYRLTKVYEYYTSQSYAAQEKLFLVRMVARGDYNLENYLTELRNAFNEFEEEFGNPDTRVHVVSVRDDVLRVPTLATDGTALTQADRIQALRDELRNTKYLDQNGYLSLPFGTALNQVSPITRNHKLLFVEAEFIGSDVGDPVGRLYLVQEGTGVVRTVEDTKAFYRLPERTAVLNPLFNGTRVYAPDVYRNYRLRDRPLVNTAWRLIINQRDESVNQDLNLQSLTDIKLYMYYTDFTRL